MLRVLLLLALLLPLSACSLGHIALPLPTWQTASQPAVDKTPAAQDELPRGLGGPPASVGSIPPAPASPKTDAVKLNAPNALELINDLRRSKGLPPLSLNPNLMRAAQMQAASLARAGTLSHIGPDGSTPIDRVRQAGYQPRMAAENVAGGQPTAAAAIAIWRTSDVHLQNLLLSDATHMGLARVDDPHAPHRTYWVLVLGTPL